MSKISMANIMKKYQINFYKMLNNFSEFSKEGAQGHFALLEFILNSEVTQDLEAK